MLERRQLGAPTLFVLAISASSPLTVLGGGIPATLAATGVIAVAVSFPLLSVMLAALAVGYTAAVKAMAHAPAGRRSPAISAPGYALWTTGFGRVFGPAGGLLGVVGYSAIGISLYGLFGWYMALFHVGGWQLWSWVALAVVTVYGFLPARATTVTVAAVFIGQVAVIVVYLVAAFTHPAAGAVSSAAVDFGQVFAGGFLVVFPLSLAAFIGWEGVAAYSAEARTPRSVGRAIHLGVWFLAGLFLLLAWAVVTGYGEDTVVDAARNPNGGVPFGLLARAVGPAAEVIAGLVVVLAVFTAMLAFHQTATRHWFAMSQEHLLPAALRAVTTRAHRTIPTGGALTQTVLTAAVLAGFQLAGADPIATMFTWLSAIGALTVLVLLIGAALAAVGYFHRGGGTNETLWTRTIAPVAGAGTVVTGLLLWRLPVQLNTTGDDHHWLLVPAVTATCLIGGTVWGALVRRLRPATFQQLGQAQPGALEVPEERLAKYLAK
ncbi:APC family permease [Dactylosporangium salmoneum]|uniref:APC family permease n=1 Tax=Dactylosporangium salmoneum TaxID=53361 RepID=A0ABP5THL2_9ACTN